MLGARECGSVLLGPVTRGEKQVERGATLGYTGRGRKGKNKLDGSRGSPRRPEPEEGYAEAGWTRIPPPTPSILFYLRSTVAFYGSYNCELYTGWTGYVTAFWLVGWKGWAMPLG